MDNPFAVLPAAVRLYAYLIAFVLLLGFTAWQTSEGNLLEAVGLFLASLAPLLAAGNTPATLTGKPKD